MRVLIAVLKFIFKLAGIALGGCIGAAIGFALAMLAGYYFIGQAAIFVMFLAVFIGGILGAIAGNYALASIWPRAYDSITLWKYWYFPSEPNDEDAL
ncbi:MAG: hypothetical protein L0H70_03035 [Xanthomonadales bacterium]|nr:hypothetical protein [Xanthomonadales bacterium]